MQLLLDRVHPDLLLQPVVARRRLAPLFVSAVFAAALTADPATHDVIVKVSGAPEVWVATVPLSSGPSAAVSEGAAGVPLRITARAGERLLVCAGATARATQCRPLTIDSLHELTFALDRGREVTGRCLSGRDPMRNATVRVLLPRVESRKPYAIPLAREKKELIASVTTGENGSFSIPHLAPGEYIFEAGIRGGRTIASEAITIPSPKPDSKEAFRIPDLRGDSGVELEVTVRDHDGRGVAASGVAASQPASGEEPPLLIEATADADGVAVLTGIDPRRPVSVTCVAKGYTRWRETYETPPPAVFCSPQKLASVSGTIVDDAGEQLTGAVVSLGDTTIRGTTRSGGEFHLAGLAPRAYELRATAPGYAAESVELTLTSGETKQLGIIRLRRGQTIEGVVLDRVSRAPLAGAAVSFIAPPGGASTRTDAEGRFSITGDRSSATVIEASASGYAAERKPPAETGELTFELARPGTLEVLAYDDETGRECAGCSVVAMGATGTYSGVTDARGTVTIESIAAGDYQVLRERVRTTSSSVSVSGGADFKLVTIEPGKSTRVQLGEAAHLIHVVVSPHPGAEWTLSASMPKGFTTATLDAGGTFLLRQRAGEECVLLLTQASRGVRVATVPARFRGDSFPVNLSSSAVRVVAAEPGARITLRDGGGNAGWCTTAADGTCVIPYVAPGAYAIQQGSLTLGALHVQPGQQHEFRADRGQ